MPAFNKVHLSGSTNGKPINITASSTPGVTIHDAVTGTTHVDEVWVWATNTSTSDVKITVEYGGTAAANQIEYTVPAEDGLHLILPGTLADNTVNIDCFAGTANVVNLIGYVNRVLKIEGL